MNIFEDVGVNSSVLKEWLLEDDEDGSESDTTIKPKVNLTTINIDSINTGKMALDDPVRILPSNMQGLTETCSLTHGPDQPRAPVRAQLSA